MKMNSPKIRRGIGCGYLQDSEMDTRMPFPLEFGELEECPGRLIRLPPVVETTHAAFWSETGQLALRYRGHDLPETLFDLVSAFVLAKNEAESEAMSEARREAKRKSHGAG